MIGDNYYLLGDDGGHVEISEVMYKHINSTYTDNEIRREVLGEAYNYANAGGKVTEDFLIKAAVTIFRNHFQTSQDNNVNTWLKDVMHLNAVACENCTSTWSEGLGKEKADSADEAMVSAHAHDWLIEKGKILCPGCKEE